MLETNRNRSIQKPFRKKCLTHSIQRNDCKHASMCTMTAKYFRRKNLVTQTSNTFQNEDMIKKKGQQAGNYKLRAPYISCMHT